MVNIKGSHPKKCEICFHKKVNFESKKDFEKHVLTKHFPFIKEALMKVSYPAKCNFCDKSFGSYKLILQHSKLHHKILKEPYEKAVKSLKRIKSKLPKNVSDSTISAYITKWKFEKKYSPVLEEMDYFKCQVCQIKFAKIGKLRLHMVIHISEILKEKFTEKDGIWKKCSECKSNIDRRISTKEHFAVEHPAFIDDLLKKHLYGDSLKLISHKNDKPNETISDFDVGSTQEFSHENTVFESDLPKPAKMKKESKFDSEGHVTQNDTLSNRFESISSEILSIGQENSKLKAQNDNLEQELKREIAKIHKLQQENADLKRKSEDSSKEIFSLEYDLKMSKERIAEVTKTLEETKSEKDDLQSKYKDLKDQNKKSLNKIKNLEKQNFNLIESMTEFHEQNAKLNNVKDINKDLRTQTLDHSLNMANKKIRDFYDKCKNLEEKNSMLQSEKLQIERINKENLEIIENLEQKNEELKSKNEKLVQNGAKIPKKPKIGPKSRTNPGQSNSNPVPDSEYIGTLLAKIEELKKKNSELHSRVDYFEYIGLENDKNEKDQNDFKLKNELLAIENKSLVDKIAVLEAMVYKKGS